MNNYDIKKHINDNDDIKQLFKKYIKNYLAFGVFIDNGYKPSQDDIEYAIMNGFHDNTISELLDSNEKFIISNDIFKYIIKYDYRDLTFKGLDDGLIPTQKEFFKIYKNIGEDLNVKIVIIYNIYVL